MSGFSADKPFAFPTVKESKQMFGLPQASGALTKRKEKPKKLKLNLGYNDKFPQRNASSIRHLFGKTSQIDSIKWGASLRWNNDTAKNMAN